MRTDGALLRHLISARNKTHECVLKRRLPTAFQQMIPNYAEPGKKAIAAADRAALGSAL